VFFFFFEISIFFIQLKVGQEKNSQRKEEGGTDTKCRGLNTIVGSWVTYVSWGRAVSIGDTLDTSFTANITSTSSIHTSGAVGISTTLNTFVL